MSSAESPHVETTFRSRADPVHALTRGSGPKVLVPHGRHASKRIVLEPGVVISPEWLTTTPLGTFAWEENYLVTEAGLEKWSATPEELPVVGD
jgi:hypothetical protein